MTLKKTLLGLTLASAGLGFAYTAWNYMPRNTDTENLTRSLVTLATDLVGSIAGGSIIGKQLKKNSNPSNPNSPSPYNHSTNPQYPRKVKRVETITDEYGRQYRREIEETRE